MKKNIIILLSLLTLGVAEAQAQSLLDKLKSTVTSGSTEGSTSSSSSSVLGTIGNIVTGILGQSNVSANSLVGTWTYKQPAVVFNSEDMLTNVAAKATQSSIEKKLQTYLDKIGFTEGKVSFTFNNDNTGNITYASKTIPVTWSVSGTDLTLSLSGGRQSKYLSSAKKYTSFTMNCKITLNTMQLSFKADKLAQFLSKVVSSAGSSTGNSTLSSVASVVNKVDGMYLGLTLTK